MMFGRLKRILKESGLCLDSIRLLVWLRSRPMARILFYRFLRLRFSPAILEDVLLQEVGLQEQSKLFSLGMSVLYVGGTYKTTDVNRTSLADDEIEKLACEFHSTRLLEVGVSDGISSKANLKSEEIAEVILTDRFNCFYERHFPLGRIYYDSNKRLMGIKFLFFYLCLCLDSPSNVCNVRRIETVNPVLVEEFGIKSILQFDLFKDKLDAPVSLIKCANILNASYFSSDSIRQAVGNLARSLVSGGYLVISHNNERYENGEAMFVLKKEGRALRLVSNVNGHEVAHLFGDGEKGDGKNKILFLIPSLDLGGQRFNW